MSEDSDIEAANREQNMITARDVEEYVLEDMLSDDSISNGVEITNAEMNNENTSSETVPNKQKNYARYVVYGLVVVLLVVAVTIIVKQIREDISSDNTDSKEKFDRKHQKINRNIMLT